MADGGNQAPGPPADLSTQEGFSPAGENDKRHLKKGPLSTSPLRHIPLTALPSGSHHLYAERFAGPGETSNSVKAAVWGGSS